MTPHVTFPKALHGRFGVSGVSGVSGVDPISLCRVDFERSRASRQAIEFSLGSPQLPNNFRYEMFSRFS